jgi:hypothetical protein
MPSGLIHDWVGAVFIPNVTLKDALQVVRDYARYKESCQPTVVDSKVIVTSEGERPLSEAAPQQIAVSTNKLRSIPITNPASFM